MKDFAAGLFMSQEGQLDFLVEDGFDMNDLPDGIRFLMNVYLLAKDEKWREQVMSHLPNHVTRH